MTCAKLYFVAPFAVEVREEVLPPPRDDELLIRTLYSAISAGSESLFYAGLQPPGIKLDASLPGFGASTAYPLSYGYALVGKIIGTGPSADADLVGRLAFAFHPHASHALVKTGNACVLPEGVDALDAVFFPNMETAVNLVLDGAPLVGERVAVLGLGIVGLLTTSILSRFPLQALMAFDVSALRRRSAGSLGATACPEDPAEAKDLDLVYELTGNPQALDTALGMCGFHSRICVGSWYGAKTCPVSLGGDFHRNRVRLFSSQVSSLAPELSGRWTKERRASVAWRELTRLLPGSLVSHRFTLSHCAEAYDLIHRNSPDILQVVFTY
ncbi:MAG: hypothetical protein A2Z99_10670 [Treponema sp. GWB1_62_6]|nr:MAG: hypothetical protein A2Z99_10670 [Treponema sp. GWB1_62_6]OHE62787.1 MAG: hypothetical protein A2Y36_06215 [Treponema sp. GWA1_62_8]OHE63660.1 MAG: hypothetical protein A2001_14165 [Treponema sp. GWC1_61_84]OHE71814.1 MAG: hypothetical protein A2413_04005 [Treponema sp. RIFOXYC1_FULL_61_9]HCM25728.1 oxidoreductase [Treponema sp.]